jgi:hypothetical protein
LDLVFVCPSVTPRTRDLASLQAVNFAENHTLHRLSCMLVSKLEYIHPAVDYSLFLCMGPAEGASDQRVVPMLW